MKKVPLRLIVLPFLLLFLTVGWPESATADDSQPLSRVAFGSCALQTQPQPIWDVVLRTNPQLFLFIGDNVYADTEDMDLMREKYAKLAAMPGFQKLKAACPIMAVWDDHDFGENDAGVEYPKKKQSQRILLDFFEEPSDSPRRRQEGVYCERTFGPPGKRTQVILLDTRYFRSPLKEKPKSQQKKDEGIYLPDDNRSLTMLGEAQWAWLKEQLLKPAEVRVIGSSVQVIAEDHSFEHWSNMPRERRRLFRLLRDTKATGVVFISGDRHFAELSMTDAELGYPLFDLTSSGLNRGVKQWRYAEPNRHRVAAMSWGDNFGLITIDWDKPDPIVSLQARDIDGEIAFQTRIPLSALHPAAREGRDPGGH